MPSLYQEAVNCLRSRLRPFRSKPITNRPNNLNMKKWLLELGCDPNTLNIIHITGTKGKGSTAAYTDSFIRAHFKRLSRPVKVGLYTSPHLVTERERIRINSAPISEELFSSTFFEVWNKVCKESPEDRKPGYLQLLALQSVLVFKKEAVGIAIYEVHAGGRKDATNMFDRPLACGFTTIGLDHADLLGTTIESITEHKCGIMKPKRPSFSVIQDETVAREILQKEAMKIDCSLEFIEETAELAELSILRTATQKQNASLATQLANAYLDLHGDKLTPDDVIDGTYLCNWPGRFQKLDRGSTQWFLDCAHNSLSIPVALSWFISEVRFNAASQHGAKRRVLIFGHESARSTYDLISSITNRCLKEKFYFDLVIFSPYHRYGEKRRLLGEL